MIRPGPKTSECEKNVTVVSTVTGSDVTTRATIHGFNKHFRCHSLVSDNVGKAVHTEGPRCHANRCTATDNSV